MLGARGRAGLPSAGRRTGCPNCTATTTMRIFDKVVAADRRVLDEQLVQPHISGERLARLPCRRTGRTGLLHLDSGTVVAGHHERSLPKACVSGSDRTPYATGHISAHNVSGGQRGSDARGGGDHFAAAEGPPSAARACSTSWAVGSSGMRSAPACRSCRWPRRVLGDRPRAVRGWLGALAAGWQAATTATARDLIGSGRRGRPLPPG